MKEEERRKGNREARSMSFDISPEQKPGDGKVEKTEKKSYLGKNIQPKNGGGLCNK